MTFKGTWLARSQDPSSTPLRPGINPEHVRPTDNPEFQATAPDWRNSAAAPILPGELYPGQQMAMPTGFGPVDHTPRDHNYGPGTAPGMGTLDAQDDAGPWRLDDQGAVAAQHWVPAIDRDGTRHLEVTYSQQGQGDSPDTNLLKRTGIGVPTDPGATERARSRRFKRWMDRYIDFHRWGVEPRPLVPRHSNPVQAQPPVPGGTQIDSPYMSSPGNFMGVVDRFVGPLVRRNPGAWDEPLSTDGTADTMAGAINAYGLGKWGL